MFRKIVLLICIAFVVVCYGYPCLMLPFGSYTYTYKVGEETKEISLQFNFNGTVIEDGKKEVSYYKLKGREIIISDDKTFDESDEVVKINNLYELNRDYVLTSVTLKNNIAMYITIGVGVLAVIMILTAPNRGGLRRKK